MDISKRKHQYEQRRESLKRPAATRYYLDEYMGCLKATPHMREARALRALWSNCAIEIHPEERIGGILTTFEPLGFHYGGGTFINTEARDALIEENHYSAEEQKVLLNALAEADQRRYRPADGAVHSEAELRSIKAVAATSTFFAGHMILDYDTILTIGLDGYRAEIEKQREAHPDDKNEFFDVMDIILDAIVIFIKRCAKVAEEELSAVFEHIAAQPPQTFQQALQLVWILHMLNGSDSFGRFDSYLRPFFERDNRENVYELLVDCFLKIEEVNQIQNMCIGGVDRDGNDNYTELTRLIIQITRELGYKGPNLCLLVTPTMCESIWQEAMDCLASGIGLPALYNNQVYVDMLTNHGYPLEESRGFALAGCSQVMLPGKCNFMNDIGMLNVMKVGELALYNGYDLGTDAQVGLKTGAEFASFDDFYDAVLQQLDYFVALEVSLQNRDNIFRAEREGYVMRTLFTGGCLEKAIHVMEGGAWYNGVELEVVGITNLADHLYAIKHLVFDEKKVTYKQLKEVLSNNWIGYEHLRTMFRGAPKFGNGHERVDRLRVNLAGHIYQRFNAVTGTFGGNYIPGEVIFTAHEWTGKATGATADGRKAGDVLADSAGASQGMDLDGPTALMRSVLNLPVTKYMLTSVVLNLRFLPGMMQNNDSKNSVRQLFETFFKQGGMQLQVNVCDTKVLRAARANPENYKSLIVRVGGYSDYFVNISQALQDEIIERTAHR